MENLEKIIEAFDEQACYDASWKILDDCDIYHQSDYGMQEISTAWLKAKSTPIWNGKSLFEILAAHPNYVPEKGYIVFSNEFNRPLDFTTINTVLCDIYERANEVIEEIFIPPYTYKEIVDSIRKLVDIMSVFRNCNVSRHYIRIKGYDYDYYRKEKQRFDDLENRYLKYDDICFEDFNSHRPLHRADLDRMKQFKKCIADIGKWIGNHKENDVLLVDDKFAELVKTSTDIDVHIGTKVNKVIQRICRAYGIDKHPLYNSWTARLGDAISPVQFTRHTIISINRIDYWTMSYGDNWCSCANIDKMHNRESSQLGMYGDGCCSSGTESYMLDPSTVVMYTVDSSYKGKDFELQDKINRCLFHIGEAKFVMGRVYPQGIDGEDAVYKQWREIFQNVMATCMGVVNYWKTEKDTGLKAEQYISYGTHYRDYDMGYCNTAGWSWNKPNPDSTYNPTKIIIGHDPICPCCGDKHSYQEAIECEKCYEGREKLGTCECCGEDIYEDDYERIFCEDNGCYYCCSDCAHDYGVEYCTDGEWHSEGNWFRDNYNDNYYCIDDLEVETEDGHQYSIVENAESDGYECDEYGHWYPEDEFATDNETCERFLMDDDTIEVDGCYFRNAENAVAYGYICNDDGDWVLAAEGSEVVA